MTNTVVEYEQDCRIAWHNCGKNVWRWQIESRDGGGSTVTETYDMTHLVLAWLLKRFGFPGTQHENLEKIPPTSPHTSRLPPDGLPSAGSSLLTY